MSAAAALSTEQQIVVFRLDSESYGIDIFRVSEIIRLCDITPIPGSESHIKGLVNLRGKTIPVVDLKTRLGIPGSEDTDATRIIVVDLESSQLGVIVDEVREVVTLVPDQIEATPALVASVSTDYVRGVAQREGSLITLLNLDKALCA